MGREFKYDADGNKLLLCAKCGELKHLDMFYRYKKDRGEISTYFHKCKECERERGRIIRQSKEKTPAIESSEILMKMGYEINNPDNPIYKQFEKKWGL